MTVTATLPAQTRQDGVDASTTLGREGSAEYPTSPDFLAMSAKGVLDALRRLESEIARLQALKVRAVAALDVETGDGSSSGGSELSTALCLSSKDAAALVGAARALTTRLPRTMQLMEEGTLDLARAKKVADSTAALSDADACAADELLAERLPGKTALQVRRAAHYVAVRVDPTIAGHRHGRQEVGRRVLVVHRGQGMASLRLDGIPLDKAISIYSRIDRLATAEDAGNTSHDGSRVDAALELLLHGGVVDKHADSGTGKPVGAGMIRWLGRNHRSRRQDARKHVPTSKLPGR